MLAMVMDQDGEREDAPGRIWVPPRAFRAQLRAMPADEFRRFVAALWAARGWTTTVDGRAVVARRDDGRARRLLVISRPRSWRALAGISTAAADAVVCSDPASPARALARAIGADVYDAEWLRQQLLYAIGDEDRDRLLREFFDVAALRTSRRGGPSSHDRAGLEGRTLPVRLVAAVAVVAVAALLTGGVSLAGEPATPSPYSASAAVGGTDEPGDSDADATASTPIGVAGRTVDRAALAAAEREAANATPACSRSPESVVQHHLVAIRNGDERDDDALASTRQFVHPDAGEVGPYAADGGLLERPAYAPLREYDAVTFDFVRWDAGTPSQRVAVRTLGGPGAVYRFDLASYERGAHRECWGLTGIDRVR